MKTPDTWLRIVTRPYPTGPSVTTLLGQKALAFPSFIQGRVLKGGWSSFEHALSDWQGNAEAGTLTVQVEDADGAIRTISDAIGVTLSSRVETSVHLLSEAGRHASLTPRVIHRGFLAQAPVPKSNRKAELSIVDVVGSHFYRMDPEATLQKVFWTREWLEAAGIKNTPTTILQKPVNIVIGEHTDPHYNDANGVPIYKGSVPCDYIGDFIFDENWDIQSAPTATQIPPPVLTANVVGTPGTTTYVYAVSLITSTGETVASATATVADGPDVLDGSNYVALSWVAPTGWATVYTDLEIAYKVFGRTTDPATKQLVLLNNGGTYVGPETAYNDTGVAVEHDPGPKAVGSAIVALNVADDPSAYLPDAGVWGVLVYALGYAPLDAVYPASFPRGGEPVRELLLGPTGLNYVLGGFDATDIMVPTNSNWPFADPWIELATPEGGTVRVSAILLRGPRMQAQKDGVVTVAVDTCGVTDTGDDTGVPITEASVGYAWIVNELMVKNGGVGYRTGAFWPLEAFSDGTTIVNTDILDVFQAATVGFIGGAGYKMHLCLTERCTVSQFHQWFNTTFNCYTGALDNGQVGVWVIDTAASMVGTPIFRRNIELLPTLPDVEPHEDEVENKVTFSYDWDPDAQAFRGDPEWIGDTLSQGIYGLKEVSETPLELRCTRDRATARDAMGRRIFHNKITPQYQTLPMTIAALEVAVGSLVRVTHQDGNGVDGWVNRAFFVVRKAISGLGTDRVRVTLTCRDVARAMAAGFAALQDETTMVGNLGDETSAALPPTGAFELQ